MSLNTGFSVGVRSGHRRHPNTVITYSKGIDE